jgi:hypothetical protein
MDVEADLAASHSASYSEVRDALDNELTFCREKLQRDIRRSHRRWYAIENETRLRLEKLGYLPKHAASPFKAFDKPNTSTAITAARTKEFSPGNTPETVFPDYHQILVSNAFGMQTPVPNSLHHRSTAHNLATKNREILNLVPEGIPDDEDQFQSVENATSTGKYIVLGPERSCALAERAQRIWYFESSITRFIESHGFTLAQVQIILANQSTSLAEKHGSKEDTITISLIAKAVREQCRIPLKVALSYWLQPEVEDMVHYCRICKK